MKTKIISAILIMSMLFSFASLDAFAFWQNEYDPSLPTLSAPKNLVWNVDSQGNRINGCVSWDAVPGCEGEYFIEMFCDGSRVFQTHWVDLYDTGNGRVGVDFIHSGKFNKTGAYTFAVTPVGDGMTYNDGPKATSGVYNFVCPAKKLATPRNVHWVDGHVLTFSAIDGAEEYLYRAYNQNKQSVGTMWGSADSVKNGYVIEDLGWYIEDVASYREDLKGLYFTVTALAGDIEKAQNSGESSFSAYYNIKKKQTGMGNSLNVIIEDLSSNNTTATEALDDFLGEMDKKDITNTDMAVSMINDESFVDAIGTLEEEFISENNLSVSVENSESDKDYLEERGIDAQKISVVGAALNSHEGADVSLKFSKADDSLSVDKAFYKNSVAVNIDIEGVKNSGDLDVPIQMKMPVPAGIVEERFVILHYHADGTVEKIRPRIEYDNGEAYALFVLTSFSPFVFCNEDVNVSYDDVQNVITILSEVEYQNAVVVVTGYKDNQVTDCQMLPRPIGIGENTLYPEEFEVGDADYIKIMVLESLATMTPLVGANQFYIH